MIKFLIHGIAAVTAVICITTFLCSTLISELVQNHELIAEVKHRIATAGLPVLILAMMAAGLTGKVLAGQGSRKTTLKKKRMQLLMLIGVVVMIPSALFLDHKASAGEFDRYFYGIQMVEVILGLIQLRLVGKNFIAGMKMSGRFRGRLSESLKARF